jgi:hypothetical protein
MISSEAGRHLRRRPLQRHRARIDTLNTRSDERVGRQRSFVSQPNGAVRLSFEPSGGVGQIDAPHGTRPIKLSHHLLSALCARAESPESRPPSR